MNPTTRREIHRNARAGNTRTAGTYACNQCNAMVLRGLDADIAAITVTTDVQPLTELGEVLALAHGRTTYELTTRGGKPQLDPRRPAHIRQRPAGDEFHVVTEHKCGTPLPKSAHRSIYGRTRYSIPDQPQF